MGNKIYLVREMMLGLRDRFQYMECSGCTCLQLLDPPVDMARYYPSEYTAFRTNGRSHGLVLGGIRHYLRKRRNEGFLRRRGWLNRFLIERYHYLPLKAFARLGADRKARILDVGCGSGTLLLDLKELGYENLLGVDRFIPAPIDNGNGVRVIKGVLEDLVGTNWDVIMFHHSFEHMPDPLKVLQQTAALLVTGGRCLIRIPIVAWAWQHYGVNWGQLDAPRHFFLHSERSFRLIARAAGLDVVGLDYDSNEFQFWVSELYSRNVPLYSLENLAPETIFSKSQLRSFRLQAAELNSEGRGDSAVFDLIRP
jgi:SAM-dependent methyltransferase